MKAALLAFLADIEAKLDKGEPHCLDDIRDFLATLPDDEHASIALESETRRQEIDTLRAQLASAHSDRHRLKGALDAVTATLARLEALMKRRAKEAEQIEADGFTESPSYMAALEDVTDEMRDIFEPGWRD